MSKDVGSTSWRNGNVGLALVNPTDSKSLLCIMLQFSAGPIMCNRIRASRMEQGISVDGLEPVPIWVCGNHA